MAKRKPTNLFQGRWLIEHMDQFLRKASVKPWPRLFHNLRASCQTELENRFPTHVVCYWLGNSEAVARKHYLQTTEEHFAQAIRGGATGGAEGDAKVVQQVSATRSPTRQPEYKSRPKMAAARTSCRNSTSLSNRRTSARSSPLGARACRRNSLTGVAGLAGRYPFSTSQPK